MTFSRRTVEKHMKKPREQVKSAATTHPAHWAEPAFDKLAESGFFAKLEPGLYVTFDPDGSIHGSFTLAGIYRPTHVSAAEQKTT